MSGQTIIVIVSWIVGAFGLLLLIWSIRGDRARGRLRCPRCWYDLRDSRRGEDGWACPECGKALTRHRQLTRTRRRRSILVLALLILPAPGVTHAWQFADKNGWPRLLPDWALVRWPFIEDVGSWHERWQIRDKQSVGSTIFRTRDELSTSNRRYWFTRVTKAVNSMALMPVNCSCSRKRSDHFVRAYNVFELTLPSDDDLSFRYTRERGSESRQTQRIQTARLQRQSTWVLVNLRGDASPRGASFEGSSSFCPGGIIILDGPESAHRTMAAVINSVGTGSESPLRPDDPLSFVRKYDLAQLLGLAADEDESFRHWRDAEQVEILLEWLIHPFFTSLQEPRASHSMASAMFWYGDAEYHARIAAVLSMLRDPVDARALPVSTEYEDYTIRAYDAGAAVAQVQRANPALPAAEATERIRSYIDMTLDTTLSFRHEKRAHSFLRTVLVRTRGDEDATIRRLLEEFESGERLLP